MKKFIKLGGLALGVFLLAGCGRSAALTSAPLPGSVPWATKLCVGEIMQNPDLGSVAALDGKFKGEVISEIAKNYLTLSGSKADALGAVVSEDGKRLVVTYLSCDGVVGQNIDGFTLDGTLVHLVAFTESSAASGKMLVHLPAFSGSNFGALYLPIGFIDGTSWVLVKGKIVDSGAGGSCATAYWMTVAADTAVTTNFTTEPDALVYDKNTKIVFVSPNGCTSLPDSLRVKNVLDGSVQVIKTFDGNTYASLRSVVEQNIVGHQTNFILNYFGLDTTKQLTLVLP